MIIGLDNLAFQGEGSAMIMQNLNMSRPLWVEQFRRPLVFWVSREADTTLARFAPDFYRFRSATIEFSFPEPSRRARANELEFRLGSIEASAQIRLRWHWELWRLTGSIFHISDAVQIAITNGLELPQEHRDEIIDIILRGYEVTDRAVSRLVKLTSIKRLLLASTAVSNDGVQQLSALASLRNLRVIKNPLQDKFEDRHLWTDDTVKSIGDLRGLNSLELEDQNLTDVCFQHMRTLDGLTSLSLSGSNITGQGITELGSIGKLQRLRLDRTSVTDDSLTFLEAMESIKHLYMSLTSIDGSGLRFLPSSSKLRLLWLYGSSVTDEGMATISKIQSLERISLNQTRVTTNGVLLLSRLPNLKEIVLNRQLLSNVEARKLRMQLPQCLVRVE